MGKKAVSGGRKKVGKRRRKENSVARGEVEAGAAAGDSAGGEKVRHAVFDGDAQAAVRAQQPSWMGHVVHHLEQLVPNAAYVALGRESFVPCVYEISPHSVVGEGAVEEAEGWHRSAGDDGDDGDGGGGVGDGVGDMGEDRSVEDMGEDRGVEDDGALDQ